MALAMGDHGYARAPAARPWRLVGDMAATLAALWPWLLMLAALVAAHAAIEPSVGWMGKRVLDDLRARDSDLHRVLLDNGVLFCALFLLITLVKALEKVGSKTVELRLIIHLQRIFVERRDEAGSARDVSHLFYGTEVAKKGFEVLYKDLWVILVKTGSITIWQMTLAPEWLPLLFLAVVPAAVTVAMIGPAIRRASREILGLQETVAASSRRRKALFLRRAQDRLFGRFVRFEALKIGAEEAMSVLIWINALALVAASYAFGFGLLPERVSPGDLALVAINLQLLADPLGHVGKTYTKWQEAAPALAHIFAGRSQANPALATQSRD